MQTWNCSVSFRWKRRPGAGSRTSGDRTRVRLRRRLDPLARRALEQPEQLVVLEVACRGEHDVARRRTRAGDRTTIDLRVIDEITSARPITGRPSGWSENTASESRSWTSSCGASSTIAISSSTTSRSESRSANVGEKTMSAITSSASSRCRSGTRA